MEATIFVSGMFHLPLVCQALGQNGLSSVVHSSYPSFKLRQRLPPGVHTHSHPGKEMLSRLPGFFFRDKPLALSRAFQHDIRKAVNRLETDIVIGWAGHSEHLVKTCNIKNIPVILERGSTHIAWQRECLLKAYDAAGMKPNMRLVPSQAYIENEMAEYENASAIHVPSEFCAKSFEPFADPGVLEKIRITRYGFSIPKLAAADQYHHPGERLQIGFAGTLSVRKGFFDFCWLAANTDHRKAVFESVGHEDNDTKAILQIYQPPFTPHPSVPKEALFEVLARWDIMILPSYEEGLSMIIPEAMSQNTVVIASDVSGASEYIKHGVNGFIFEHGNRQQLTDIIDRLISEPEMIVDIQQALNENNSKIDHKAIYFRQYGETLMELLKNR